MKNTAAIILAAGQGKRFKSTKFNKVVAPLKDKPIISYTVDLLDSVNIKNKIVVIGFSASSVKDILKSRVTYAVQTKQLGTGHALKTGLTKISNSINTIIVLHGDDSAFYTPSLLKKLVSTHQKNKADVTFLSIKLNNPFGIGRVVRNQKNQIIDIVEQKNATKLQKKIKEVNAGLYCFRASFIKKYIDKIKPNPVNQEYYLTDMIKVAIKHNKKVKTLFWPDSNIWFGINSKQQLQLANKQKKRYEL